MGFITSFKKNVELLKISKVLGKPVSFSVEDLLSYEGKKYEDKLYDLVEKYDFLREVLEKHSADRDDLSEIYNRLIMAGAGQWVNGNYYVAASALAFHQTLDFVLHKYKEGDTTDWQDVAYELIVYFKEGKVGEV